MLLTQSGIIVYCEESSNGHQRRIISHGNRYSGAVRSVVIALEGQTLASISVNKMLKLWRAEP